LLKFEQNAAVCIKTTQIIQFDICEGGLMKKVISIVLGYLCLLSVFAYSEKGKKDLFVIKVKPAKLTSVKKDAFSWLDTHVLELSEINEKIWRFAEVAMEEYQSSELLASFIEKNGLKGKMAENIYRP